MVCLDVDSSRTTTAHHMIHAAEAYMLTSSTEVNSAAVSKQTFEDLMSPCSLNVTSAPPVPSPAFRHGESGSPAVLFPDVLRIGGTSWEPCDHPRMISNEALSNCLKQSRCFKASAVHGCVESISSGFRKPRGAKN